MEILVCQECMEILIPEGVILDAWLSSLDVMELTNTWPQVAKIEMVLGMSKRSVCMLLKRLEGKGYLYTHEDERGIWVIPKACSGRCKSRAFN